MFSGRPNRAEVQTRDRRSRPRRVAFTARLEQDSISYTLDYSYDDESGCRAGPTRCTASGRRAQRAPFTALLAGLGSLGIAVGVAAGLLVNAR